MKEVVVPSEHAGIRIDSFLTSYFLSSSRGDITRAISNRLILVNGKATKPSYKVKDGDIIHAELLISPDQLEPNQNIEFQVIAENSNFIIINKPAGLQVHPDSINKTETLANGLIARYPEIIAVHDNTPEGYFRPGIVHRLDRDTSGVMVIARNLESLIALKQAFQERKIEKKYLAVVWGTPKIHQGTIQKSLAKSADYRKQIIANSKTKNTVRTAETNYQILKNFGDKSLIEAQPLTGRTHQIRVHLASIGCPIVGDPLYTPKVIRKIHPEPYSRLMLHATQLSFELFGSNYHFSAPLPPAITELTGTVDDI